MKTFLKPVSVTLSALCLSLAFGALAACQPAEKGNASYELLENTQELVVIRATEGDGSVSLETALEDLEEEGKIAVEIADGMVTSLNGQDNPADWSACWMIYTDLFEMEEDGKVICYADTSWSYSYEGETYYSVAFGVSGMPIYAGYTYIFHYDLF